MYVLQDCQLASVYGGDRWGDAGEEEDSPGGSQGSPSGSGSQGTVTLPTVTITAPANGVSRDFTAPIVIGVVGQGMDYISKGVGTLPFPQAKGIATVLWVGAWGVKGLAGALAANEALR